MICYPQLMGFPVLSSLARPMAEGLRLSGSLLFSPPCSCTQPLSKEAGSSVWRLSDNQPGQEGYDTVLGGGHAGRGQEVRRRGHGKEKSQ